MEDKFRMEQFDKAVLEGTATWWQMDLPSGEVIFGDDKPKMLGYPESKFKHYQDFTALLHPDDNKKAMKAMYDHLEGKKKFYETIYRIKHKNGKYITFYDCGQITKKQGDKITVIGFVMKVKEDMNPEVQMKYFKDLILNGTPSIIELVEKIK